MSEGYIVLRFLAGTEITKAIQEAKRLSNLLACGVQINFNGWETIIENQTESACIQAYKEYCKGTSLWLS
jgi:hypothetical protein